MTTVKTFAPAKVNLTLHITGQRDDGYHLIDSLVSFADVGDVVSVSRAERTSLTVSGPFAADVPTDGGNLVLKAVGLFGEPVEVALEKNLPAAAGIGGGSADAAATVKAVSQVLDVSIPDDQALLSLGADVPVCMMTGLVRMRGIGELLEPISTEPLGWPMVLVNPGVPVSTPDVFKALNCKTNSPMDDQFESGVVPHHQDAFFDWLEQQRNDLEAPAISLAPVIGDVKSALQNQSGCRLARMSGSGSTCFGLFECDDKARRAAGKLSAEHPEWWVAVSNGQATS